MIEGHSVLAVIPARAGSKGLPRKNLRLLGGKPLIDWTVAAARGSSFLDRVILSTEDEETIAHGRSIGCDVPFRRPDELATDTARTIHVLHHLLENIDGSYDYVVQLQPTSPFRTSSDIDSAIRLCLEANAPACVSVCPVEKSPQWIFSLRQNSRMQPLMPLPERLSRRQDMPPYYELNGAIYVARVDWIRRQQGFLSDETVAYVMPQKRSLDIDDEIDLALAEILLPKLQGC